MKNNFLQKINNVILSLKKKKLSVILVLAILFVSFTFGGRALASDWAMNLMNGIIESFFNFILSLLGHLIAVVIGLARYSGFTTAAAVVSGWVIVRDICNLFFIVILLVIAFSTILRVGGYSIKETLPKLLIMAILINFSKTICGLIIDVAQIVMLSFLAPLRDVADWGFSEMFGIQKLGKFASTGDATANPFNIFSSYILALIMILIAAVVLVVMIGVLTMRIVMLWIYVAISPLAYFLSTFPQGSGYARKWWSDFTENVLIGPILAFFLWLSFVSVGSSDRIEGLPKDIVAPQGLTAAFNFESLSKFAISIGMLIGGLMISQSMAGGVGKIAGTGLAKINAGAGWTKKKVSGAAMAGLGAGVGAGLAVTKGLDRLPGVALGAIPGIGGSRIVEGMSRKGLVGGTIGSISKIPEKIKDGVGRRIDQNYDLKTQMRANKGKDIQRYKNQNGVDRDYKINKFKKLQEWDKEKNTWAGGVGELEKGDQILQKKSLFGGMKGVGEMSNLEARWHETLRSSGSVARAARFDVEDNKAEAEKKKIVRFDEDQLHSLMASMSSSVTQKRAAAELLAERGKFNDYKEIEKARSVFGSNGKALDDFNEKVDLKQAHKAYNLDKPADIEKFHSRIEKGKIDIAKFDRDSLPKENVMRALEGFYGDDLPDMMKKLGARALSKKDKEAVGKAYETASRMHMKDATDRTQDGNTLAQKGASVAEIKEMDNKANDSRKKAYTMAKEHAKFTGQVENSFAIDDGNINIDAVKETFGKFKPKDFENVTLENIDALIKKYGAGNVIKEKEIKKVIADSLSVSTLQKMASNGDQTATTRRLVDIMVENGYEDKIRADKNLKIVLDEISQKQ